MTIRGIDVSAAQGVLDWKAIAASGIRFAYLKATSGNDPGIDPFFERNVAGARDAGIAVGAYGFGYPLVSHAPGDGRTPQEQARIAFAATHGLGANAGDLGPALDLEWPEPTKWRKWGCSDAQICDWALGYLAEIADLSQRRPIVYTYPDFWGHTGGATRTDFAAYSLWLADYATASGRVPRPEERPRRLPPWTSATVWQHDGNGGLLLPGGHDADFDVFLGDEADFAAFCNS